MKHFQLVVVCTETDDDEFITGFDQSVINQIELLAAQGSLLQRGALNIEQVAPPLIDLFTVAGDDSDDELLIEFLQTAANDDDFTR